DWPFRSARHRAAFGEAYLEDRAGLSKAGSRRYAAVASRGSTHARPKRPGARGLRGRAAVQGRHPSGARVGLRKGRSLNDTASEKGKAAERLPVADREADLRNELAQKQRKILTLEADVAQRETEIRTLEAALAAVYSSTTWKLGTPLRLAKRLLARVERPASRGQTSPSDTVAAPAPGADGPAAPAPYPQS